MRANFTNIENATKSFLEAIENMQQSLFVQANTKRVELLAIYQDLLDSQADITKFGEMMNETACALLDASDVCNHVVEKIEGTLDFGYDQVPQCSFQHYVDTCEVCGLDIMVDQEYTEGEGGHVHISCLPVNENEIDPTAEDAFDEEDELPTT